MKKILIATALFLASFSAFSQPVNINTADAITIADSIKGIGLTKAKAIIDYRNEHGRFNSADELVMVKGIGTRTVEKIRSDILLEEAVDNSNVSIGDQPALSDAN